MNIPKKFYHTNYDDWIALPDSFDSKRFLVKANFRSCNSGYYYTSFLDLYYILLTDLEPEDLTYLTLRSINHQQVEDREEIVKMLNEAYLKHTVQKTTPAFKRGSISVDSDVYYPDTALCLRIHNGDIF